MALKMKILVLCKFTPMEFETRYFYPIKFDSRV